MSERARTYRDTQGTVWTVTVQNPGASNAQLNFLHPDGRSSRDNRYAQITWGGRESQNTSGRVDPAVVLASLDDAAVGRYFRRSMSMAGRPVLNGRVL
jgi:hypothetical protein